MDGLPNPSRAEHLAWCKQRALEYVDQGDLQSAVTSMLSDLAKHSETKASAGPGMAMLGIAMLRNNNPEDVRRFVTGFN